MYLKRPTVATNKSIRAGGSSPEQFKVIFRKLPIKIKTMFVADIDLQMLFSIFCPSRGIYRKRPTVAANKSIRAGGSSLEQFKVLFRELSIKSRTRFVAEIDLQMLFSIILPI